MTLGDGVRLGAGTFLAIPVPPPRVVDRRSGAVALLTAPLWGAAVAGLASVAAGGAWWIAGRTGNAGPLTALLAAAIAYAAAAWLTRGMHLDGLADTADGFGSGRTGTAGLAVMRDPGVGAFAAVTLVATAGLQVTALGHLIATGQGPVALVAAAVLARAPLAWIARAGTPSDGGGLARTVVGAVAPGRAAAAGPCWSTLIAVVLWIVDPAPAVAAVAAATVAAWLGPLWLRRAALRRFGVLTGDVLGASVEVAATSVLVVLALLG